MKAALFPLSSPVGDTGLVFFVARVLLRYIYTYYIHLLLPFQLGRFDRLLYELGTRWRSENSMPS